MRRLHPDTLGELAPAVEQPAYDRTQLRGRIVHLGIGAFHRAHQAVYTDAAIALAGGDWGIVGVSLRSADVARRLLPQDCLYSVMSEDARGARLRVVAAVTNVLVAPDDPGAIADCIADPEVALITLTVTEKGYHLAVDGESLDTVDPAVAQDLRTPEQPTTAIGLLALGLRRRMAAGNVPLTILSCDNLSENSRRLRGVLTQYLEATFVEVLPWLNAYTRFPCSMVDRIVPAMTGTQQQRQAQALGLADQGAVATEPFSQWIIEDDFAGPRPAWEGAGARLVDAIPPYENIKLGLLNACHSAIAYCGMLAGCETVDAVMADNRLRTFVTQLATSDLLPALVAPPGFDLVAYRDELLKRFSNPALGHRCAQIAMDGSEKIPQRWLPALQNNQGEYLLRALSAWCYYVLFTELAVDDPRAAELLAARGDTSPVATRVSRVLKVARITPQLVKHHDQLVARIAEQLALTRTDGVYRLVDATRDATL